MKIAMRLTQFVLLTVFPLSALAQATNVPGKPFEYLASLSQSAMSPVVIKDANGTEMGTYLGFNTNNNGVFLGFSASVEGETLSFVVDANQLGFHNARGSVLYIFPWVDDQFAADVARICTAQQPNTEQWAWDFLRNPASPCGQAITAYIEHNNPCGGVPFLHILNSSGISLSVGGFFDQVLTVNPGATILRVGDDSTLNALTPSRYSHSAMIGLDNDGECRPLSVRSTYRFTNPATVEVNSFEALGDLYDTYTPPFEIEFK